MRMIQEGEGHWPSSSENLLKARYLWVLRTPQNNKEEGARAKELVTCGTRGPFVFAQPTALQPRDPSFVSKKLELELIQTQMAQKPMLRAEVGMRVRCANKASAE